MKIYNQSEINKLIIILILKWIKYMYWLFILTLQIYLKHKQKFKS